MDKNRQYIAIDLKSFYASVECMERGLDPMTTLLTVADSTRTEKTICLAVSPSLKAYGIGGRARLFEVVEKVREANAKRKCQAPCRRLVGKSYNSLELSEDPSLAIDYIVAPPRMARYMEISTEIYNVYLKYIAPEDIHVYSIDEVFIDVTHYLGTYGCTAHELALKMIRDVLKSTGITATAGIGTNLYLAKVAMDIMAKKMPADKDGVRIAELDEMGYRRLLWSHTPLTSFWRVGRGYAAKLEAHGIYTMGDIARCSIENEELLYNLFGINAELLIDHAWGYEPCLMSDIKSYKPKSNSIGSGQVLSCPYSFEKARIIVHEMTDLLVLDLVDKGLLTDLLVLEIGYDTENLNSNNVKYKGEIKTDFYGRKVPKNAHESLHLPHYTSSSKQIIQKMLELYDSIIDRSLSIKRVYITAATVISEKEYKNVPCPPGEQLDLFTDFDENERKREDERQAFAKEQSKQKAILGIKERFGKNAVLKGINYEEGATTKERNEQIGGHKA